jgi:hypothetical protein
LVQTSTKRRNIIIVSIIIVVLVVSSIAILVELYYQSSTAKPATSKLDVSVSLNQTNVIQGNNLQAEVNITSKGNPENITLSAYEGSSSIRCSFDPVAGTSNFTSLITMNVPDSTPTGNYLVTASASGDGEVKNASYIISVLSANITVSGIANISDVTNGAPIIERVQFTDTKTNSITTAASPYGPTYKIVNYSVTLQNEHSYKVTISYLSNPLSLPMNHIIGFPEETINAGTLTVKEPEGNTTMSGQNFPNY